MKNPPRNNAHASILIMLVCIPIFIGALDLTVVTAVLPHIILELEIPLQTGLEDAAWIVTGYLLAYSISMVFMGRLSDLRGRREVFLLALGLFAFGSYLVAVAQQWPTDLILRLSYRFISGRPDPSYVTLYALIAARMIQAFGAGTMVPVGMALVADLYPENTRARQLGVIAAVDTAGWVVGHLYGGIIVRYWDWQTIFWLNLPVCLMAFLFIWYFLQDFTQTLDTGKMDWIGTLLIACALTILNVGLSSGAERSQIGLNTYTGVPPYTYRLILTGIVFFGLFLWRQASIAHPIVDLSLFKRTNFLSASGANFLIGFSLFIAIANVPLFINAFAAASPEQAAWDSGWMLSALTIPMALASIPGGWLSERYGYRLPSMFGLVVAVMGFSFMKNWDIGTSYRMMMPQLVLTGIGIGLTMAPIASAVVNSAPPNQRGTSSALVIIFRLIGMTIGTSSITTYDLIRVDALSEKMLSATPDLNETVRVGMEVTKQVISESFIIAGAIALLALIPALLLKNQTNQSR